MNVPKVSIQLKKKPHGEDPDGLCTTSVRITSCRCRTYTDGRHHNRNTQSGLLGCHAKETGVDFAKERNISRIITTDNQHDANILTYLLLIGSTCFGRCFRPSSGAYHCNYSFWYCLPMLLLTDVACWVELT